MGDEPGGADQLAPSVFISSSSEGSKLAHRIKELLGPGIRAEVWDENVFRLGEDTLTNLLRFARLFDFGIQVYYPDDRTISRDRAQASPRDNVVFETGLFMGALGRRRAFTVVVESKGNELKLPSNLLGNSAVDLDAARLDEPGYLEGHVRRIAKEIGEQAGEAGLSLLPSTALAIGYYNNFLVPVCSYLDEAEQVPVDGKPYDLSRGNYRFRVVVPRQLKDASVNGQRTFVKRRGLGPIEVKAQNRSYPFFVHAEPKDGYLQLCDFPTTLKASYDTIQRILGNGALGQHQDYRRLLEAKERENFIRALRHLLSEEAREFGAAGRVEIEYDD